MLAGMGDTRESELDPGTLTCDSDSIVSRLLVLTFRHEILGQSLGNGNTGGLTKFDKETEYHWGCIPCAKGNSDIPRGVCRLCLCGWFGM